MYMKFSTLFILTSLLLSYCTNENTKPFATANLQEGLPPSYFTLKGYENPFYAEVKSNDLFYSLYFVKDTSKEVNKYLLFMFPDSNRLTTSSRSMEIRDSLYYDSLTITLDDEEQHLVDLEIYYNQGKNEIKYHWINSFESNTDNPGGFPQIRNPKVPLGTLAPDFNVLTHEGDSVSLASLRGKNVYVDFWGTWCGGCIMEIPNIKKLREYYSSEDLYIIGLAAYDDQEKLSKFLKENPLNYPTALIGETLVSDYGVRSFPSSFLIDKTGEVIAKNLRGKDLIDQVKSKINDDL